MQRLGHVELRALEDALGDPERDAVDEVALPELERRRRCLLQSWEVGEVAAERLPALGLLLARARPPPPGAAVEHERAEAERRVGDQAGADADEQDVRVARVDGAPVAHARGRRAARPRAAKRTTATTSGTAPVDRNQRAADRLVATRALERREAPCIDSRSSSISSRKRESRSLPPSSTPSTTSATSRSHARSSRSSPAESSRSEIVSVSQAAPDRALGRRRHGLVDASADQVEERRRELVRAGLAALARAASGRARARCRSAAPARTRGRSPCGARGRGTRTPPDDEERRDASRGRATTRPRPDRMRLQRVDAVVVGLVALRVGELLLHDPVERVPRSTRMPDVDVNAVRGMSVRSSTNWCAGTSTARSVARVPDELDVAAHPHGLAPGAEDLPRATSRSRRAGERRSSHWSPQTLRLTSTTSS